MGKTECEPIRELISDVMTDLSTGFNAVTQCFLCGQQPKSGPGRPIVEVSISHTTDTHTHTPTHTHIHTIDTHTHNRHIHTHNRHTHNRHTHIHTIDTHIHTQ